MKPTANELFIEKLSKNNIGYINKEFIVVGKLKAAKKKILLKDRYGYCKVLPYDLTRGVTYRMTIKSAVNKTQYLIEYLRQNSKEFHKRRYRIVSEYTKAKEPILILDNLGNLHKMSPHALMMDKMPSLKSAVDKDGFISNELNRRNEAFKNKEIIYLSHFYKNQTMFLRVSDKFGEYIMNASTAYNGSKPTIEVAINKDENLRNRLKQNGGCYDYSHVYYTGMKNKVNIHCKLHGMFLQNTHQHMHGDGCPKCGVICTSQKLSDNPTGWKHSEWIISAEKSKYFESFKCYIVKLKSINSEESFYKIGRTYTTLKKRFKDIKNYTLEEIVHIFEDDAQIVIDKEIELLRKNKINKYKPSGKFGGSNECFINVIY